MRRRGSSRDPQPATNHALAATALRRALATRQQAFALRQLASGLAVAAHSLALFAGALFGRLFIGAAGFHLTENTFALQFLLKDPKGLVDVVVSDENLQWLPHSVRVQAPQAARRREIAANRDKAVWKGNDEIVG
jgi:hypothetical protein